MHRRAFLTIATDMALSGQAGHANMANRDLSSYIFVAARTRAEVAVIDSQTDIVVERITLSGIPDQMLTLGKGAWVVVADAAARRVQMINVTNGRIEHSWAVPLGPRVLGTNKIGNRLVALDPDAGKVVLIPVYDRRVVSVVDLSGARYAVFDPRERLLVAHNAKVAIINATGQHTAELIADPTDGPITHLATDPGGEYVFAVQRGVLSIFDLRNEKRAAVLRLPAPLGRVVPSADSQFALLPVGGHALSIISNWTLQESHRIEVGGPPVSVGLMLFQSVAAIAVEPGHRLFLYDLQHRHPLANLRLPGTPEFGASPSNGTTYYVALSDTGQVAVVDLSEHMSLRSIDGVGRGAWAVVPAIGDAYCH